MENDKAFLMDNENEETEVFAKASSSVFRWVSAFKNSYAGLKYGWQHETAIREELILLVISIPLAMLVASTLMQWLSLVLSVLFILVVEVLNTAIEVMLDRVSTEINPLTKVAKDLGSLAVLLASVMAGSIWIVGIYSKVSG